MLPEEELLESQRPVATMPSDIDGGQSHFIQMTTEMIEPTRSDNADIVSNINGLSGGDYSPISHTFFKYPTTVAEEEGCYED